MKSTAGQIFKNGAGNCAQAVALAWADQVGLPQQEASAQFAGCGGGRAPEGLCGALHAARELAGTTQANDLTAAFARRTGGHTRCRDIRRVRSLPCASCVELAAELLEEINCGAN